MENLLDELKNIVEKNNKLEIIYEIEFSSRNKKWGIDIWCPYIEDYIFTDCSKHFKDLLENAIKELKTFIFYIRRNKNNICSSRVR